MDFLKKIFNDDDRLIGLSGFKKEEDLRVFVPKFEPDNSIYNLNYQKNFFLL